MSTDEYTPTMDEARDHYVAGRNQRGPRHGTMSARNEAWRRWLDTFDDRPARTHRESFDAGWYGALNLMAELTRRGGTPLSKGASSERFPTPATAPSTPPASNQALANTKLDE